MYFTTLRNNVILAGMDNILLKYSSVIFFQDINIRFLEI